MDLTPFEKEIEVQYEEMIKEQGISPQGGGAVQVMALQIVKQLVPMIAKMVLDMFKEEEEIDDSSVTVPDPGTPEITQ